MAAVMLGNTIVGVRSQLRAVLGILRAVERTDGDRRWVLAAARPRRLGD
jgi:hypothetical protein